MSDSVWYYARGEQEKGPITTAQIKALAAAGKLQREDFVWKEGMENWVPASEVPGLIAGKSAAATSADSEQPTQQSQPDSTPIRMQPGGQTSQTQPRTISRAVFVVGLLMALLSRGCDSLGDRNVVRRKAMAEAERREFQDRWDRRESEVLQDQERLNRKSSRTAAEATRLRELGTALAKLREDRDAEESALKVADWLDNDQAAVTAVHNDQIWSYWRQVTLLLASLLCTLGVLGVAYTSDGPERWASFILLIVLFYSLFAANGVWSRIFA